MGSYDFVVSIICLPSEESPMVSVGKAKERLGSSRVSMKDDKNSRENRSEGPCGGLLV